MEVCPGAWSLCRVALSSERLLWSCSSRLTGVLGLTDFGSGFGSGRFAARGLALLVLWGFAVVFFFFR